MTSRREFVSAALIGLTPKGRTTAGGYVNETYDLGHRLRDRRLTPTAKRTIRIPLVIVGGGIAGLSAAWRLQKRGFKDFILLEMEQQAGGNSRHGQNDVSVYPWAAHYIPVPAPRLTLVRELMEDLGVLREGKWDERMLCHSPQERVFVHGRWHEGFEPETRLERDEWNRFEKTMEELGASGDFTIPVPERPGRAELDDLSMRDWLDRNRFKSEYLRWYVDYACRDDYGAHSWATSAWMGIHYFASRDHDGEKGPLTWPEGNGWVVRRLTERLRSHITTSAPVVRVSRTGAVFDAHTTDTLYRANGVIWAAPSFLTPHIVEGAPPVQIEYSPWVTANLTVDRQPKQRGFEPAWDNVIVGSPSLGYVIATHMSVRTHIERTVWTWYHALGRADSTQSRRELLASPWSYWRDFILADLERAHPDIRECVSRIDVMRLGHAMARPVPGALTRGALNAAIPGLYFANSDQSGYSIFEEAQSRGVAAAERAVARLGS
jgi:glycine/D-amino acid oxidase-like deaminating enzyme